MTICQSTDISLLYIVPRCTDTRYFDEISWYFNQCLHAESTEFLLRRFQEVTNFLTHFFIVGYKEPTLLVGLNLFLVIFVWMIRFLHSRLLSFLFSWMQLWFIFRKEIIFSHVFYPTLSLNLRDAFQSWKETMSKTREETTSKSWKYSSQTTKAEERRWTVDLLFRWDISTSDNKEGHDHDHQRAGNFLHGDFLIVGYFVWRQSVGNFPIV